MSRRRKVVGVRVDPAQLRRIDALVARVSGRSADGAPIAAVRSDVLRLLISYGLPVAEQMHPPVPADTADPE